MSTSLTDTAEWRGFCAAAANDLTLLDRDPDGILSFVVGGKEMREARYDQIADELERRFHSLHGFTVLEVGGGYGGQAAVLQKRWRLGRYAIGDLPDVQLLQHAYLTANGCFMDFLLSAPPDLAISCYAVSECHRDEQIRHIRNLRTAKRGYIRWNGWIDPDGIGLGEFIDLLDLPTVEVWPEPGDDRNRVLLWSTV